MIIFLSVGCLFGIQVLTIPYIHSFKTSCGSFFIPLEDFFPTSFQVNLIDNCSVNSCNLVYFWEGVSQGLISLPFLKVNQNILFNKSSKYLFLWNDFFYSVKYFPVSHNEVTSNSFQNQKLIHGILILFWFLNILFLFSVEAEAIIKNFIFFLMMNETESPNEMRHKYKAIHKTPCI